MLAVRLPPEIADRLDALSRHTGRSRDEHVHEAILEHLDELEDVRLAERRLDALARGGGTVPLANLLKRYGPGD